MNQAINENKKNIFKILSPYYLMHRGGNGLSESKRKRMVVFFGANFKDLPGADRTKFTEITGQCLDFIRQECPECEIYYKPHPAETDEFKTLNLGGIELIKDSNIAEFFLWKNAPKIKYVFSVCSGANISAYYMGFNSYVFPGLLEEAVDRNTFRWYRDGYFKGMPDNFFITDLNQKISENKKTPPSDPFLEKEFGEMASRKTGRIWFLIGDPNSLVNVILLTQLIRDANPLKKVNLIIMKHRRWQAMNPDDFKDYFDELYFFPRIFYSLRPQKLLRAIKAARAIKSLQIGPEDILIGNTYTSFIENCLVSFHKPKLKMTILPQSTFDLCCSDTKPDERYYFARKSVFLWNKLIEPVLGLERTIFMEDKRRIMNFYRYRRPLNDIYDKVFLSQAY